MSIEDETLKQPKYVPASWLYGALSVAIFAIGCAFSVGFWKNQLDSRVLATEISIQEINSELRFRIDIRAQIMAKLDDIQHRLSIIEGKLSK